MRYETPEALRLIYEKKYLDPMKAIWYAIFSLYKKIDSLNESVKGLQKPPSWVEPDEEKPTIYQMEPE